MIDDFVNHVRTVVSEGSTVTVDSGSRYHRLFVTDANGSKRIYAFVDRKGGSVGKSTTKEGDILRAASITAPAATARGNIADQTTWTCAQPHGIAYLKIGRPSKAGNATVAPTVAVVEAETPAND
jgi:hypothetical protein